ncbi:MAG: hypothetical protein IPK78_17460 [Rhodospirillales bacterium]|nr:hypothetical protein [Rhodospirillales bacterium]
MLSTDAVPGGGGATFGNLGVPSINAQGCLAFNAGNATAIYSTGRGRACGPLARAVGAGDQPPGVLGPLFEVDGPSLNDDGSIAFRGFASDTSVRGLYLFLGQGRLRRIADAATRRPGTSETFLPFGPSYPVGGTGAHVVFGDSTSTTEGVYLATIAGVPKTITLGELVTQAAGFTEVAGAEFSTNSSGVVALALRRSSDLNYGVYLKVGSAALQPIAVAGDPAPGGGTFDAVVGPSINDACDVAFVGFLPTRAGLFLRRANGMKATLVSTRTAVPNHPGVVFSRVGSPYLASDRTLVFAGSYRVPDPVDPRFTIEFQGIYRRTGTVLEVIYDQFDGIVVDGVRVALVERIGPATVLRMAIDQRYATDQGNVSSVAFLQQLPGRRSGVFRAVRS